jgi:hypothetical protein
MKLTVNIYADPSHSWAAIKRNTAVAIMEDHFADISGCSYQRGKTVYLEEDCDFPLFVSCANAKEVELDIVYHHTDRCSQIRNYPSFRANCIDTYSALRLMLDDRALHNKPDR